MSLYLLVTEAMNKYMGIPVRALKTLCSVPRAEKLRGALMAEVPRDPPSHPTVSLRYAPHALGHDARREHSSAGMLRFFYHLLPWHWTTSGCCMGLREDPWIQGVAD